MKKISMLLLCMLLVTLCACGSFEETTYSARRDGVSYLVDRENQTISDGTHTYRYVLTGDSDGYSVRITYPNGSSYWWETRKSGGGIMTGYGGWSDDYDEERYAKGDVLCDILEASVPEKTEPKNILIVLLLLAAGIFNAAAPHTAWYLEYGWRYKDAEPSDLALAATRFGGVAAIAVAVIMIFV